MARLLDAALDASLLGYTKLGPAARRRSWKPPEDGALRGRVIVVTGATAGIGAATARGLAGLGAHVVIVGRNGDRADEVRGDIESAGGSGSVELADLSSMTETRALADRLADRHPRIHGLVNNAGVLLPERQVTAEGIERTLATNLLSHFLLTNLLIPRLTASAPARVINVSSGGMYTVRISIGDLQNERDYDGRVAYARTKRGQVILTEMWAERLAGTGVVVHSMHPGWSDTAGVASGIPLFHRLAGPVLRTAELGADTIVWLMTADEAAATSGGFWHDRRLRPTHRLRRTRETLEQRQLLWGRLAELSGWSDQS